MQHGQVVPTTVRHVRPSQTMSDLSEQVARTSPSPQTGAAATGYKMSFRERWRSWFSKPTDYEHKAFQKMTWAVGLTLATVASLIYGGFSTQLFPRLVGFIGFAVYLGTVLHLHWKKQLDQVFVSLVVLWSLLIVTLLDIKLTAAGSHVRAYHIFLLIVHLLLILGVDFHPQIVLVLVWGFIHVVMMQVELSVRFGLLDFDWLTDVEERLAHCDCNTPPCPTGANPLNFHAICVGMITFCLDVYSTKTHAHKADMASRELIASVLAAQSITESLATWDLVGAEHFLVAFQSELPEELASSLEVLMSNLRTYRPYLPQSILSGLTEREDVGLDGSGAHDTRSATTGDGAGSAEACSGGEEPTAPPLKTIRPPNMLTDTSPTEQHLAAASSRVQSSLLARRRSQALLVPVDPPTPATDGPPTLGSVINSSLRLDKSRPSPIGPGPLIRSPHPLVSPVAGFAMFSAPKRATVTLFVANLHDTVSWCQRTELLQNTATEVLTAAFEVFPSNRGIVDLFLGDRIFVSFNASRGCSRHATRAVAAAKDYHTAVSQATHGLFYPHELTQNCAIATGNVTCGDLGCDNMRRYSLLGRLPVVVWALERVGRGLGLGIACNTRCWNDAWTEHELRLVAREVAFVTRVGGEADRRHVERIYEALASDATSGSPTGHEEWMYQMQAGAAQIWDAYNKAVRIFLNGASVQEALATISGDPKARELTELLSRTERMPYEQPI